jgi:hypothetical protein
MRMQGNGMRFLGVGKINLKMKSIWKKSRGEEEEEEEEEEVVVVGAGEVKWTS